jgi:hypothetical protein
LVRSAGGPGCRPADRHQLPARTGDQRTKKKQDEGYEPERQAEAGSVRGRARWQLLPADPRARATMQWPWNQLTRSASHDRNVASRMPDPALIHASQARKSADPSAVPQGVHAPTTARLRTALLRKGIECGGFIDAVCPPCSFSLSWAALSRHMTANASPSVRDGYYDNAPRCSV